MRKGGAEYEQFYKVELEERKAASRKATEEKAAADMRRVEADLAAGMHGKIDVIVPSIDGRQAADEPG